MMILALLGILLLALYTVASTAVTITMGDEDAYQDAQAWADELDASLACPMQVAVDLGLIRNPWLMPTKLAALLAAPKAKPVLTLVLNDTDEDDTCPVTLRCAA